MGTVVDRLYSEHEKVVALLDDRREVSRRISTEATLRKVLVLSAASYFESCITRAVLDFVGKVSGESRCVMALVEAKAVKRQYYTYFQWEGTNANSFFALFGTEFKIRMRQKVQTDEGLDDGIKALLAIGLERNKMVHSDFGSYQLDKTTEEIMGLYHRATAFVEQVPYLLSKYGLEKME